jgi:hypothetical protein
LAADAFASHRRDGLLVIQEPSFSVKGKRLNAYAGAILPRDEFTKSLQLTPAERPFFLCQLRLQLLTSYFQSADAELAGHWRPYLTEAARITQDTRAAGAGCNARINELLGQAATAYARKRGLTMDDAVLRSATIVSVTFRAEPATGTLLLVDELTYRLAGQDLAKSDWSRVGGKSVDLAVGDYRVKAIWDNGASSHIEPISVRRADTFVVKKGP